MPYINKEDRSRFDEYIDALAKELFKNRDLTPGEFNYVVSRLIWKIWWPNRSYTLANSFIGSLECIKMEFYRRFVSHYEDGMIHTNGDVEFD